MLNSMAELAGKYAQALFELAEEEGVLPKVKEDVAAIADVFGQNAQLVDFFANPFVDNAARKDMMGALFQGKAQTLSLNFVMLLAEKRLERLLPLVVKSFNGLFYEKEGIVEVRVTTARALSAEEYGKVAQKLQVALKKSVALDKHVDKNLVGGIILQIGDRLVDGSVSQRLRKFGSLVKSVNDQAKGVVGA